MIGSPDLLAFTGTEGFGEEDLQEAQSLPEELSIPLLPSSNPWTSTAQFHTDFILVAEFSEQVGPKPVLTIPDDPRVIGSFDLNHFSVRIMSVDYQASGPGQAPPPSPGPRLNFSEDSKVVLGDSAEDAYAYVHHLTLYDLEARGMVRPFCMAYVCSDQAKLMENFSELSTCFSQASESLKTGNRQAFSMELQRKLQELEYKRVTLQQETSPQTVNGFAEADELEAVERSISNHRDLLRQVTSYPNRKLKQPDFLPYDPADSLTDPLALLPPEPPPTLSSSPSCRSERRLKPLQELCNIYFLSLMKDQLAETERHLRGDKSALRTTRITRSLSRRLTLTNFLFELWTPEDGDEEERDSAETETQRATGRKSAELLNAEPLSLESFCSCVEEIPIKLVAGEALRVSPDPSVAMEMTGSISSNDSIEVLGTEKSYRTQHDITGLESRETHTGMADTSLRRAAVEASVRRVRAYARRANSEDSIEVLSTTESIFPDDLTAITEEEAESQPLSNGLQDEEEEEEEEILSECRYDNIHREEETVNEEDSLNVTVVENESETPVQEHEGGDDREESVREITVTNEVVIKEESDAECLKREYADRDNNPQSLSTTMHEAVKSVEVHLRVPDVQVDFAPPAPPAEVERWSPPSGPLRLLSIDEASDCTSFSGTSDLLSPTQSIHGNSRSERKRRRKAGLRALRFLKHHSFSQHAVFCLLSGRPLVVIGGDEVLLRKQVDGLSLFLPAPLADGSAVMPSLTSPLQLTDLLTWRLIGIHRSSSSTSSSVLHSLTRYSRYLALLDLDQKTLRCPPYSGSLITRLADPLTGIRRGLTYLLHVESCLTALANQVLLYTFNTSIHCPDAADGNNSQRGDDFLLTRGHCTTESDLRVIRFLSDLVKQRHAGRGPQAMRFYYSSMTLHRNTLAT